MWKYLHFLQFLWPLLLKMSLTCERCSEQLCFAALWPFESLKTVQDVFASSLLEKRSFHNQAMDMRSRKANPTDESCDNVLPLSALTPLQTERWCFLRSYFILYAFSPDSDKHTQTEMTLKLLFRYKKTAKLSSLLPLPFPKGIKIVYTLKKRKYPRFIC